MECKQLIEEGKHIKRLNLFDKVIIVRLSDVLVMHHRHRFDAILYDADGRFLLFLFFFNIIINHFVKAHEGEISQVLKSNYI